MTTYVKTPASEIFSRFKGPFWRHFTFTFTFTFFTFIHDEAEGGRYATSLCFGFAAGQVGTPWASRHSVNPQQICFAEIRKYKNINSSWLVGVQSFSEIGDRKILTHFHFHSLSLTFTFTSRLTLQVSYFVYS